MDTVIKVNVLQSLDMPMAQMPSLRKLQPPGCQYCKSCPKALQEATIPAPNPGWVKYLCLNPPNRTYNKVHMYTKDYEVTLAGKAHSLLKSTVLHIQETQQLLQDLAEVLNFCDWRYYVKDDPILADAEYDILYKWLRELEHRHPAWIPKDSPTRRVAKGLSKSFPTVQHLVPMLSLDNSYNAEDLREWDLRSRETLQQEFIEYCVEPKYDGAGISLIYEDDLLVRGATRGDGAEGEDVTVNIKQMHSVPLSAKFSALGIQQMEIRGEVLITKDSFRKFNQQRLIDNLPPLANPRNAASGTLRMLDPKEVGKRGLEAFLYHMSYVHYYSLGSINPTELKTHKQTIDVLSSLGFKTPSTLIRVFNGIDGVVHFCREFEEKRDELPYEVDGLVIKVNSYAQQEKLGMTSHHPRWAMAFKFKARQATSKLLKVEFQVGRTGSITPVAKIEPVPIGGVTVSSVSLFNEDVIKEKNLMIGDTVLVERAGDVIPYIVKSLAEIRSGQEQPIEFPDSCPVCHHQLFKPEGESVWRCVNLNCKAQVVERIIHFASKDAMDIRTLGESNIRKFYDLGLLNSIADIYHLDLNRIQGLAGFGKKSAENLKEAIEASKKQPLHRLIFALGIRHVGETTAKTLANAIGSLQELSAWTVDELSSLEDIGPKVAQSIYHFFHNPDTSFILHQLEQAGINLHQSSAGKSKSGGLSGSTFLFTGTLESLTRKEAETLAENLGAQIIGGVSSKLNYLVVGAEAGSKLEKARKMTNIRILNEQEFLNMIRTFQENE